MDFISIWVAIFFAYHYAKNLKLKSPIMAAVDTAVTFMLVAGAFVDTEKILRTTVRLSWVTRYVHQLLHCLCSRTD